MEVLQGQRLEGVVKSWRDAWGWISSPDLGGDVFVHVEDVVASTPGAMLKDAVVTFELGTDQKSGKQRARNVEVAGQPAVQENLGGARLEGTVESWREAWGWIHCPELSENIFGHKEDLVNGGPLGHVEVGARVTFEAGTDEKSGKPRAKRIELLDVADNHQGIIASWKDQWGWIRCPEFQDGDIFAHSDDLLTVVHVGMDVSFEVGADKQGRRRAKRIAALVPLTGLPVMKGAPARVPTPPSFPPPSLASVAPPPLQLQSDYAAASQPAVYGGKGGLPPPQAFVGQRLEGEVNSWKDLWGWISSPVFGGDLFAHQEDTKTGRPLNPGTRVRFTPGTDKQGRMRALMIEPLGAGGLGPVAAATASLNFAQQKRKANGVVDLTALEGQQLEGEVASWKSPWGWVRSPSAAGDIFAHKEDVASGGEELEVGQIVSFLVARDIKSGRWRARQIHVIGVMGTEAGAYEPAGAGFAAPPGGFDAQKRQRS